MPDPTLEFEGINGPEQGIGPVLPPDPSGDVGLTHYVQMVNVAYSVWDKTGTRLVPTSGPPPLLDDIWASGGLEESLCATSGQGDPIVVYDELAGRWVLSQFAFPRDEFGTPEGPFHECIAVSQGEDPTASFYLYDFLISETKMNDYPKIGVWPDGYYMTANQFDLSDTFAGALAAVFERDAMLTGDPSARVVKIDLAYDGSLGGMLPADLDGPAPPPQGSPNWFMQFDDLSPSDEDDLLRLFGFHVDWSTPTLSTFQHVATFALSGSQAFDSNMCDYSLNCISTGASNPNIRVDAISDRLMWRLAYRNLGTHESMVLNHTVDASGSDLAGIRWYEIRDPSTNPTVHQLGNHSGVGLGDTLHRWMGSIAMDAGGNMALGYSTAASGVDPAIRYAGRLASDTLGQLLQTETVMEQGGGSPTHESSRWGDYTSMSVDPGDDCSFWYTNEYYPADSDFDWHTRIGTFSFPGEECDSVELGSITGQVLTSTGAPIPNAWVKAGARTDKTNGSGVFVIEDVPFGTYALSAWKPSRFEITNITPITVDGTESGVEIRLTRYDRGWTDFNGDGYGDVASGAPQDRTGSGGPTGGAVNVLYGSALGLTPTADDRFHQDSPGVGGGAENSDAFGRALAAGDFDGDGFSDLAIGSPFESIGTDSTAGQVNVLYGSAQGLTGSGSDTWHQDSTGVRGTREDDDRFGSALAAGDFDDDGEDDLAIGVPGEDGDAGVVQVLYGSASGLTTAGDDYWSQNTTGIANSKEAGDLFGDALAAGNFDNEFGFDLAIGVPHETLGTAVRAGAVTTLYSAGGSGLGTAGDEFWHQNASGVEGTNEGGDRFGFSLAAGDFDNNRLHDLAIGVPYENLGSAANAGLVNVLYGAGSNGLSATGDQVWTQGSTGVPSSPADDELFGYSLTAGDIDGDRRADLAIGVPLQIVDGEPQAGAVNVIYGVNSAGLGGTADLLAQGLPMFSLPQVDDVFGFAVGAGDYNGDGFFDLTVGVPGEYASATVAQSGALSVVNGTASGPSDRWSKYFDQLTEGVLGTAEDGDNLGWSVTS